jgi:hypothetical protein
MNKNTDLQRQDSAPYLLIAHHFSFLMLCDSVEFQQLVRAELKHLICILQEPGLNPDHVTAFLGQVSHDFHLSLQLNVMIQTTHRPPPFPFISHILFDTNVMLADEGNWPLTL